MTNTRETQWRGRAKALAQIARDFQFRDTAATIRLAALNAVITPEEMAVFNARIREMTAQMRAKRAASRAPSISTEKQSEPRND